MPSAVSDTTESTMRPLVTAREPVGAKEPGDPGSKGDQALKDALAVIIAGWALLFILAWSLRRHNV